MLVGNGGTWNLEDGLLNSPYSWMKNVLLRIFVCKISMQPLACKIYTWNRFFVNRSIIRCEKYLYVVVGCAILVIKLKYPGE